ncbi:TPM domain-containing protein [Lysobacter sp. LF1]|uniref:TPM domain-containing protein n=1 Tax=Lysobacter stagni TaxID=3045172 RepID=A0ABT6XFM0_9GAMM|nr:TPM domain-containing protein [Lysobacter sp. LF1]MDI9238930.1 TPM domain-containing protein [Lysobacter sp. LF1]
MRLFKHLFPPSAKRLFPGESLQRITQAIARSEQGHTGEICFAVEPALHPRAVLNGTLARDRAHEVFASLRVWDTHANNGVLLYLLLADHRIEIVADRGFAGRVSDEQWRGVCQLIEERLRAGEAEAGVMAGVEALSAILVEHFPRAEGQHDANELPDLPYIL